MSTCQKQRVLPSSSSSKPTPLSKEQEKEIAALMQSFKEVQDWHAKARAEGLRRRSLLAASASSSSAGAGGAGGGGEGSN